MPHFVSTKDETVQNMNDIASDFACLKVSALKKASRISGEVDRITIGPDSAANENENENENENGNEHENEDRKSENIENEQNSCNISATQRSSRSQNKTSTQSGITFSAKKILLESEYQRKEEVRKEIERHWQHMKENGKAIQEHMAMSRLHMAKERERKSKENYAYILAEERIAEQEEIRRRNERQKEVEDYRRYMKEKVELTKKIMSLRNVCDVKFRDIVTVSESCKDKSFVPIFLSSFVAKLEEMRYQIKLVDEKVMLGGVTPADLDMMEKIVQQCSEVLCIFKSEVDRINARYEASLAAAETAPPQVQSSDSQKQEVPDVEPVQEAVAVEQISGNDVQGDSPKRCEEEQKQVTVPTENVVQVVPSDVQQMATQSNDTGESDLPAITNTGHLEEYVDKESLRIYMNSQKFLENYVKDLGEFLQSAATKKFRFDCQKAINIPVNAISGINEQHLRDKYERLHSLLTGKSSPNFDQHPQAAAFCINTLAKKIVNQGETLVSSKPKMAFPIAAVVVALWNEHPEFGNLLLSHFHNVCPFTVPVFMPKMVGQSNEDYYKLMGYKYAEDGTVEKHDKYLKRMSGLMRLYASIIITTQRKGISRTNPHGLQNAWQWLAAVLNIEPRKEVSDLCATLLLDMLEVAGSALWSAYPKQFRKLLIHLSEEYYPRMKNVGSIGGGPLVRLEEFLQNSLAKGSIPLPDGQLPPNFW